MANRKSIISINIKALREEVGLTQEEFAKIFEVSKGTISIWEKAISEPFAANLKLIANHFGISVIEITRTEIDSKRMREIINELQIVKDFQFESTELNLKIPPPPDEFTGEDLQRYDKNAGLLLRWAHTDKAQKTFPNGIEEYALERFCIEAAGFYSGGWIDDVSGLLKDFIEEGK